MESTWLYLAPPSRPASPQAPPCVTCSVLPQRGVGGVLKHAVPQPGAWRLFLALLLPRPSSSSLGYFLLIPPDLVQTSPLKEAFLVSEDGPRLSAPCFHSSQDLEFCLSPDGSP